MKVTLDTDVVVNPLKSFKENVMHNAGVIKDHAKAVMTVVKEKSEPVIEAAKTYGLGIVRGEDVHFCSKCGLNIETYSGARYCPRCGKRI